jgi:steroid delta-isomerase-like uncharacterized protein
MKSATPKEGISEWLERVWKARDKSAVVATMAEDAVAHLAGGARGCGIAQFSSVHDTFFAVFPDLSVRMLKSVGDDTPACLHWEVNGAHRGDFAGIAPTRRKAIFSGMSFVTIRNGKITEGWDCWDFGAPTAALSSQSA